MEEILNIAEKLEEFNARSSGKYGFPAVSIRKPKHTVPVALFNRMCNPLYKEYVQLKMSDNYVFFRFTDVEDQRYYRARKTRTTREGDFAGFQVYSNYFDKASLTGKTFKLYKYKDGYLINVREPLGDKAYK